MRPEGFWLGTHKPNWLWGSQLPESVPLFVSYHQLMNRRDFGQVGRIWALDSGGFSEVSRHGRWTITPRRYVRDVRWYMDNLGGLVWAAPQDWMCEPHMLERTGLTIANHQCRTLDNYLRLRDLDPFLPFIPVLQGWSGDDYERHIEMYDVAGVDLTSGLVGIGSVCRRQATAEIGRVMGKVASHGIRLHGFGVKTLGLEMYGQYLASSDSLAWSFQARRKPVLLEGCTTHANCANCEHWALLWYRQLTAELG